MLEKDLQGIGLNDKEARVYLAALELGQSTVQEIAKKSGVNRATAYFVIDGLMKSGLMSSFHKDKKQYFSSADPDRLIELLEQEKFLIEKRESGLKKLLPQLQSINNKIKDRPVVKYYEGKEGIKTMVEEVSKPVKNIVRMAYSRDAILKNFSSEELDIWSNKRKKNDTQIQVIYTYKEGEMGKSNNAERRRVPLDKFPIKSDIAIYDDKIRLASFEGRMIGIIIEDKELADSLRAVLDLAWEAAEKYQQ